MYIYFKNTVHEDPSCTYISLSSLMNKHSRATDFIVFFMNAHENAHENARNSSETKTSISNDVCELVILDFACRLVSVVSKSQGQATLDFTSDLRLTKNASWPKRQGFTMTSARWPVLAGFSWYHPDHKCFNITVKRAFITIDFVSRNILYIYFNINVHERSSRRTASSQSQSPSPVIHSTIVHEREWNFLMTDLVISSPWIKMRKNLSWAPCDWLFSTQFHSVPVMRPGF